MSKQQDQTWHQFFKDAESWNKRANKKIKTDGVIEGRMKAVLSVIESYNKIDNFLDVGCGTGELVLNVSKQGINSLGIDFSEKMIDICNSVKKNNDSKDLIDFQHTSFFDMEIKEENFDVISAQGFIEYISRDQLLEFFSRCYRMLKKNGSLVVGSRNRLFNIFSHNEFTEMEIELGVLDSLLSESIFFARTSSINDIIKNIPKYERKYKHPTKHPKTHVNVESRYQYSPAELIYYLKKYGFKLNCIYPINFHGLMPGLKNDFHDIHLELADTINKLASTDIRLIPQSSTFVLDIRKY